MLTAFRRRVFCVVVFFFRRLVVRRFLCLTLTFLNVFDAFRFLVRGTLASAATLATGNEGAATSASSCNSTQTKMPSYVLNQHKT